ncbi:hypothetical protein H0N96_01900 [Candidatus Micrarchaeota archaeon]|nr:hypothetical protein [Candidatus Micrarchaeota archaeon]
MKSVFRSNLKIGICEEDSASRKYPGKLLDKVIKITSSYDSKGIQLADILVGVCGRMLYRKDDDSKAFYNYLRDKVKVLLDNRKHEPTPSGTFMRPTPPESHFDLEVKKPDLSAIHLQPSKT